MSRLDLQVATQVIYRTDHYACQTLAHLERVTAFEMVLEVAASLMFLFWVQSFLILGYVRCDLSTPSCPSLSSG